MKGAYRDPVDHARTTHQHAGESLIDTLWLPGLLAVAMSIVSIAGLSAAVGYHRMELLSPIGLLTLALLITGFGLITAEHHRVNRVERRWNAEHPDRRSSYSVH